MKSFLFLVLTAFTQSVVHITISWSASAVVPVLTTFLATSKVGSQFGLSLVPERRWWLLNAGASVLVGIGLYSINFMLAPEPTQRMMATMTALLFPSLPMWTVAALSLLVMAALGALAAVVGVELQKALKCFLASDTDRPH